jgi:hypothetical protein
VHQRGSRAREYKVPPTGKTGGTLLNRNLTLCWLLQMDGPSLKPIVKGVENGPVRQPSDSGGR